ncbi:hypothetical protein Ahy_B03g066917 [Arachis hypogaea]|uniref:PB1-like domain-containing protein n=1 Tax=Arachis hypogaea TaxID=3818 RepID=A0A445A5C0_ARAHY|nr:hypothetical protein Ahy_B03g066917 [Arachis hypogaea]
MANGCLLTFALPLDHSRSATRATSLESMALSENPVAKQLKFIFYPLFLPINPKGEAEIKESWLCSNKSHDSSFNERTSKEKDVVMETGVSGDILDSEEFAILIFHHRGKFVRNKLGELSYWDELVERFPEIDLDLMNFFDLKKLFKSLGYDSCKAMIWFDPNAANFEASLHLIFGDSEINALREHKMQNKECEEFYIYFKHHILTGEDAIRCDEAGDLPISDDDSDDDGYESAKDELYKSLPLGFDQSNTDIKEEHARVMEKKGCRQNQISESNNNELLPATLASTTALCLYCRHNVRRTDPCSLSDSPVAGTLFFLERPTSSSSHRHASRRLRLLTLLAIVLAVSDGRSVLTVT